VKPLYVSVPADGPVTVRGTSVASTDGGAILVAVEGSVRTDDATEGGSITDDSARIVLEAYRQHGPRFAGVLRGRYAVAIVDRTQGVVYAAGDRMGSNRVHYAVTSGGSVVSTSLEEVSATPAVPAGIDLQAIYDYLYLHAIPAPRTFFSGVRTLRRAEAVALRGGSATVSRHWSPRWSSAAVDADDAAEELRRRLRDAVSRSVQAGPPRADCFLSGGLDSSSVAGTSAKILDPHEVGAYSIGFAEQAYDETEFARAAAERFGMRWHRHQLDPDEVLESLPAVISAFEQPFGNSSSLAVYHCARFAAAQGVTRLLAGDGGDEIFGGNTRYAKQLVFQKYWTVPAFLRSRLIEPTAHRLSTLPSPALVRKACSYVQQARVPLPDRLQSYNFVDRLGAATILTDEILAAIRLDEPRELMRREYGESGTENAVDSMMFLDWQFTLHDNDLVKVNTMCRHAGVEVEYPMLDDDLVEFACRLPADMKVRDNELRWLYRRAMRGFLPDVIIDKKKHGFGLPFGVWTRTHEGLSNLARDALHSLKMRRIVRPEFIDHALGLHRDVHAAYYGELVWILMVLELWFQARMPRASF
jgi:asparagine synthase (glutamine-hydrolysing)